MAHPFYDVSANQFAMLTFEDASNRPEYVCETMPQSQTNENQAQWRIYKITYHASGGVRRRRWANGSNKFEFNPTLRLTYTY